LPRRVRLALPAGRKDRFTLESLRSVRGRSKPARAHRGMSGHWEGLKMGGFGIWTFKRQIETTFTGKSTRNQEFDPEDVEVPVNFRSETLPAAVRRVFQNAIALGQAAARRTAMTKFVIPSRVARCCRLSIVINL